jgi:hypothetical protein
MNLHNDSIPIGRTMLAAYHLRQQTFDFISKPCEGVRTVPFFEGEGFLPVTIFEAEGAPPFAFFEGWDDGWSSALRTFRIVEARASPLGRAYVEAALQGRVSPCK